MEEEECAITRLPFDVADPIYHYCSFTDLISLSQCCKYLRESVSYITWRHVRFSWRWLVKSPPTSWQLHSLQHTMRLTFTNKSGNVDGGWKNVSSIFESILQHCDPYKLSEIRVSGMLNDQGVQLMLKSMQTNRQKSNSFSNKLLCLVSRRGNRCRAIREEEGPMSSPSSRKNNLQEIHISHCASVSEVSLVQLCRLVGVRRLTLSHNGNIPPSGFLNVANLIHLQELNVEFTMIDNNFLLHLQTSLRLLHTLNISSCNNVDNIGLSNVWCIPTLTHLNVSWCTKLTDDGFLGASNVNLIHLNVQGCHAIGEGTMAVFSRSGCLQELNIGNTNITDGGLAHLRDVNTLEELVANGCGGISDRGMQGLVNMSIKKLDLSGRTSITDVGFHYLSRLSLCSLKLLNCTQLTDFGLQQIGNLSSLVDLNIDGCGKLTDIGIANLKRLKSLEELSMYNCPLVTERGLADIALIKSLKVLRISPVRAYTPDVHAVHIS